MWPILIVSIVALTVVIERCFWWGARWFRRDPKRVEKVFTAIETGDVNEASKLARGSRDPVLRMLWNGLNHQHASLQGALQVAAGIEIKRAGRFLVVMDTLVTLAPLLGLFGTITGLIRSFSFLGNEELAVQAVTGGIAEALIATACGLGIAIFALIPFNFFTSRVSNLEFELQTAATNLEVMLEATMRPKPSGYADAPTPDRQGIVDLEDTKWNSPRPSRTRKRGSRSSRLIDIMFFLLASFMMVSLSQVHMKGMKVNLPTGISGQTQNKREYVSLSVDKDGQIYFDKTTDGARSRSTSRWSRFIRQRPGAKIFIRGDRDTYHGDIIRLIEQVRSVGLLQDRFRNQESVIYPTTAQTNNST